MSALEADDVRRRVDALAPWFHDLDLNGIRTAPNHFLYDYPNVKWRRFQHAVPVDLSGKTVLDIGCNAGFYALEMKKRGADRVIGIDSDARYLEQARFAADVLNLDVEFRRLEVWDLAQLGERFDLVLFMGVFYHLRHPLLALDLIWEHAAQDLLLFQSLQRGADEVYPVEEDYDFFVDQHFNDPGYPKMHFIEHRYSGDPTNWWAPNAACAEALLRNAGFTVVDRPEREVFVCRKSPRPYGAAAVYPAGGPVGERW